MIHWHLGKLCFICALNYSWGWPPNYVGLKWKDRDSQPFILFAYGGASDRTFKMLTRAANGRTQESLHGSGGYS